MVNLPPVGGLIPTRDESSEAGVIHELQELDGLMIGSAAVGVQGEEQKRKKAALRGVRNMFPQLHMLPPVRQEVCNPETGRERGTRRHHTASSLNPKYRTCYSPRANHLARRQIQSFRKLVTTFDFVMLLRIVFPKFKDELSQSLCKF